MRVHWLQHAEHEGLGCIEAWMRARGHTLSATHLYRGETPPDSADLDWLIVLGGPMNIYEHDRFPWLIPEKIFIRDACVKNKKILGICLGAQLLADVLGGSVRRNHETEIGWFNVSLNDEADKSTLFMDFPASFEAFHWHGDTFAYPPGATPMMSSEACPRQAFSWGDGRVVALQFHLEVELADARRWLQEDPPPPGRYVQTVAEMLREPARFAENTRLMQHLLQRMAVA